MSSGTSSEAAPALKGVEFFRWIWTQLTSMRTALLLLFLLALAAIPGSLVPQTSISPIEVMDFKAENPTLDRFFEPLGMYDVYSSPWFSAIYILLFVSLAGCIIPRIGTYLRALRTPPPRLPKRPERMATSTIVPADAGSIDRAADWLRSKRYRVNVTEEGVSAERGYLREAGNLTFHTGLVFMLAGLAWSSLFGFQGSAVVVEGHSFTNVITQYDDFTHGGLYDRNSLEPFTLAVNDFHAEFETGDVQRGAARRFDAEVTVSGSDASGEHLLQVNHPLSLPHGTQVNLLGHGYAVQVTVTDGNGDVAFSGPVVMLPQDGNFASVGVVKAPDARPDRLAMRLRRSLSLTARFGAALLGVALLAAPGTGRALTARPAGTSQGWAGPNIAVRHGLLPRGRPRDHLHGGSHPAWRAHRDRGPVGPLVHGALGAVPARRRHDPRRRGGQPPGRVRTRPRRPRVQAPVRRLGPAAPRRYALRRGHPHRPAAPLGRRPCGRAPLAGG